LTQPNGTEGYGQDRGRATARPVTLVDIFYVLFKHKRGIIVTFLTAVALSFIYAITTTPVYEAETKILVKLGREKISEINAYTDESYNILFQERTQNINNEIELIKGRYLAERVLDRLSDKIAESMSQPPSGTLARVRGAISSALSKTLDAVKTPFYALGIVERESERTKILKRLMASVRAEFLEDTDIIRLSLRAHDPDIAAMGVNAYAAEYLAHHIAVNETDESLDFYTRQIHVYEDTLKTIEEQLATFLKSGSIADIKAQKDVLLRDLADLEKRYDEVAVEVETTRQKLADVKEVVDRDEWVETPDLKNLETQVAGLTAIDNEYVQLISERDRLLEKYQPSWRDVKAIDSQLAKLREQKISSLTRILNTRLSASSKEIETLRRQIEAKRRTLASLNDATVPLEQLRRERSIIEDNYLLYKKKAEELRISEDLNKRLITSVKIVNPAIPPLEHVYPRRGLVLLLGTLLGLFAGFGYAFVSEFFNHTFRNEQDVAEVLGLSTLVAIPDASMEKGHSSSVS
jgi:uncharacterized protein involved in exopolysaccharide biosynthesis